MPEGGGLKIAYKELGVRDGESPVVSCDLTDGPKSTRRLLIAGTDYTKAQAELLGYSYLDNDGNLVRSLPQRDWDQEYLWASRVNRVNGIGWRSKAEKEFGAGNVFAKAAVDVDFAPRPYDVLDESEIETEFDRFVSYELTSEGEYLSLPLISDRIKWSEGPNEGEVIPGNLGKIVSEATYVFTWHQIPYYGLPFDAIRRAVGRVNSVTFASSVDDALTFAPHTLLLVGAGYRIVRMPFEAKWGWDVEYMMRWRAEGWDTLIDFKADPPDWYQFSFGGDFHDVNSAVAEGVLLYDNADFYNLFSPP